MIYKSGLPEKKNGLRYHHAVILKIFRPGEVKLGLEVKLIKK